MSLGPLTCDKRRERDPQGGRSREGIRGKYLHMDGAVGDERSGSSSNSGMSHLASAQLNVIQSVLLVIPSHALQ